MSGAETVQEDYKRITNLLEQQRLKEALAQLDTLQQTCGDWTLHNRLEQVKTSYGYMLSYMQQGMVDPDRDKIFHQLVTEAWAVLEQTYLALLDGCSRHYYHFVCRTQGARLAACRLDHVLKVLEAFPDEVAVCRLIPDNPGMDTVLKRYEETLHQLFFSTWCNREWSREEVEQAEAFLHSELLPPHALSLFTSAVTLSLMECIDPRKFTWLQKATTHVQAMVNQRALVGLVMVMLTRQELFLRHPELLNTFELFNEGISFGKLLNRTYLVLLHSCETEKVNKKMREEILPEMIEQAKRIRDLKSGVAGNNGEEDFNPDWGQALDDSGFSEKMREMSELQMEGADIYMSTFSQLKHFPFFRELPNWFYPFDRLQSDVVKVLGIQDDKSLTSLLLHSGFFCNSDKYSLAFMMDQLTESQRNTMFSQLAEQGMEEWVDEEKMAQLTEHTGHPQVVCMQYVHDLYRFFKLNSRRMEFKDVFRVDTPLIRIKGMHDLLCEPESLRAIADFLFRKEHYVDAGGYYDELLYTLGIQEAELFQKRGYCHERTEAYEDAIRCYRTADTLKSDNLWTIRHLAVCYRNTGCYDMALEYFRRANEIQPDNLQLIYQTGMCLVNLERYDEALQYFFRLDFMKEDNCKAWRAIGWYSFVSGKYEQAAKYCHKVLAASQPSAEDYLNAAHVAWCIGDISAALPLYAEASGLCDAPDDFRQMFMADEPELVRQGFRKEDILLLIDCNASSTGTSFNSTCSLSGR